VDEGGRADNFDVTSVCVALTRWTAECSCESGRSGSRRRATRSGQRTIVSDWWATLFCEVRREQREANKSVAVDRRRRADDGPVGAVRSWPISTPGSSSVRSPSIDLQCRLSDRRSPIDRRAPSVAPHNTESGRQRLYAALATPLVASVVDCPLKLRPCSVRPSLPREFRCARRRRAGRSSRC
jgi:hypothetical protein